MSVKAIVQDNYISGVANGKPFSLNSSHPTFAAMKRAIERKNWTRVPKLISLADQILSSRNGAVTLKNGVVYYHGRAVHSSLTARIIEASKRGEKVSHFLKFLDNLYQNPDQRAVNELYDWLVRNKMPITDRGCFAAYKVVDSNFRDKHTGKFDNSVGAVPMMPRKDVDPVRERECSQGLHFCSLEYVRHFYGQGDHLMGVEVNPKDVVSIPRDYNYSKGRAWRYEVVLEIADADPVINGKADAAVFQTSVLPLEADRKKLLAKVLAHPTIKRAITRRKIKVRNLRKGTLGRLTKLYAGLPVIEVPPQSKLDANPIKVAREAASLTVVELAAEMDIAPKAVHDVERFAKVGQKKVDIFVAAIKSLADRKAVGLAESAPEAAVTA